MKRLLMFATKPKVLRLAKELGFDLINFDKPERMDDERRAIADHAEGIDWNDPSDYLGKAMQLHLEQPIDAVAAFGEYTVYPAALVKEHLGTAGNPLRPVYFANEKALLRRHLEALPDYAVRFSRIASRDIDVDALTNSLGLPLILKPTNGSSSKGVALCSNAQEVRNYLADWDETAPLMAEEFLAGPELSVEGFSAFGQHVILQMTLKETTGAPNFIETAHRQPAGVSAADEEAIRACVTRLLDLIGHELGPSHTELRLTSRGPRIIETHTRPGGDGISDLTELSTGVDAFAETLKVLKAICDKGYEQSKIEYIAPTIEPRLFASSQFFLWAPGTVAAIAGLEAARQLPGVVELVVDAKIGTVLPTPVDSGSRHGHFIVTAATKDELDERIARVRALVTVELA